MLGQLASTAGTTLVVGSPHLEYDSDGELFATNAAFVIGADGRWLGRYDKVHLVPWGEYVPLSWLFRFVAPLVHRVAGFRHGDPDQDLFADEVHGIPPFAMAICYEVVFPDHMRRQVAGGATFLTTITNDAWFGATSAPYQHFSMARMRAVENRRYLVRAANTGISGAVDPWGRVLAESRLDEVTRVSTQIEPRTSRSPYVVWGDLFARLCVVLGAIAVVLAWRERSTDATEADSAEAVP
jgi:apolipoprotein N-acyltransferase